MKKLFFLTLGFTLTFTCQSSYFSILVKKIRPSSHTVGIIPGAKDLQVILHNLEKNTAQIKAIGEKNIQRIEKINASALPKSIKKSLTDFIQYTSRKRQEHITNSFTKQTDRFNNSSIKFKALGEQHTHQGLFCIYFYSCAAC